MLFDAFCEFFFAGGQFDASAGASSKPRGEHKCWGAHDRMSYAMDCQR